MRIHTYFLMLVAALALASCKPADTASGTTDTKSPSTSTSTSGGTTPTGGKTLVGKWSAAAEAQQGATDFSFGEDGKFVMTMTVTAPGETMPVTSTAEGTYTTKEDALTMHWTAMTVASDDPKHKDDVAKQNAMLKEGVAKMPEVTGKVTFSDDSTAMLAMDPPKGSTEKPKTMTLKRKS